MNFTFVLSIRILINFFVILKFFVNLIFCEIKNDD